MRRQWLNNELNTWQLKLGVKSLADYPVISLAVNMTLLCEADLVSTPRLVE